MKYIYGFWLSLFTLTSAVADTIQFYHFTKSGDSYTVSYKKDFATCAHLYDSRGQIVHVQNFFCETGAPTSITLTARDFTRSLSAGESFKLCHGNNCSNVFSSMVTLVGGAPNVPQPVADTFDDDDYTPVIPLSWEFVQRFRRLPIEVVRQQLLAGLLGFGWNPLPAPVNAFQGLSYASATDTIVAPSVSRTLASAPPTTVGLNACPFIDNAGISSEPLSLQQCLSFRVYWSQTLMPAHAQACYQNCLNRLGY